MKLVAIVYLALITVGCSVGTSKPNHSTAVSVINKLTYVQDPRTGQCFAMVSTSHARQMSDDGLSITWVPCEPKVLQQIDK